MSGLRLIPKGPTAIPVEADCLTPEVLTGLSAAQVSALPVWQGNQQALLGDFFQVEGSSDGAILIDGDIPHVKWVGTGMIGGRIEVRGAVGMHAGSGMKGGELIIRGDAGDYLGAEMASGLIQVGGSAGHSAGAGYRGSPSGMSGGVILIQGSARDELGAAMGRGLIAVLGDVGNLAGVGMHAGTILVGGRLGLHPGAWMERGSIVAWGELKLPPTFLYATTYAPPWLPLHLRTLRLAGAPVPPEWHYGNYRLYSGDMAVNGKGEVLLWASN